MADISIFDDSGGIKVFQINLKGHTNDIWNLIKLQTPVQMRKKINICHFRPFRRNFYMKIGKKFILRASNFFISIFDDSDGIEVFQINWKRWH